MKLLFIGIKPMRALLPSLVLMYMAVSIQSVNASYVISDSLELDTVHKVILQGSYLEASTGREEASEENNFQENLTEEQESLDHSFKYEGYYTFSSPQRELSSWEVLLRPWVVSNSSNELSDPFGQGGTSFEGEYLEMREFYVRKNILFGNPSYALTLGRQQYSGDYGIWWDDSIESVQFDWDNTSNGGFIAYGQRLHSYSYNFNGSDHGTTNDLIADELDIAYLMAEYWIKPYSDLRVGVRLFAQNDFSVAHDNSDSSDFTGTKIGFFAAGNGINGQFKKLDYYADVSMTRGTHEHINSNGFLNGEVDSKGWAFLSDIGYQLSKGTKERRISVRWGMTDKPDNQFAGNYVAPIQSDRATNVGTYSTGISGTFLDNRFTNVVFAGVSFKAEVDDRSQLEFMVFDIRQRNSDLPLSATIGDNYADGDGKHIGKTFEVFYFNKMFPTAVNGNLLDAEYLVSAGFFNGGDAIVDKVFDFRFSVGINLRY